MANDIEQFGCITVNGIDGQLDMHPPKESAEIVALIIRTKDEIGVVKIDRNAAIEVYKPTSTLTSKSEKESANRINVGGKTSPGQILVKDTKGKTGVTINGHGRMKGNQIRESEISISNNNTKETIRLSSGSKNTRESSIGGQIQINDPNAITSIMLEGGNEQKALEATIANGGRVQINNHAGNGSVILQGGSSNLPDQWQVVGNSVAGGMVNIKRNSGIEGISLTAGYEMTGEVKGGNEINIFGLDGQESLKLIGNESFQGEKKGAHITMRGADGKESIHFYSSGEVSGSKTQPQVLIKDKEGAPRIKISPHPEPDYHGQGDLMVFGAKDNRCSVLLNGVRGENEKALPAEIKMRNATKDYDDVIITGGGKGDFYSNLYSKYFDQYFGGAITIPSKLSRIDENVIYGESGVIISGGSYVESPNPDFKYAEPRYSNIRIVEPTEDASSQFSAFGIGFDKSIFEGRGYIKLPNITIDGTNDGWVEVPYPQPNIYLNGGSGDIEITGQIKNANSDCAEEFELSCDRNAVELGTVMVLDDGEKLCQSSLPYDRRVAGVVSGAGAYKPGIILGSTSEKGNRLPIALAGKVYCKVDATFGAIKTGDLLTTAPTVGHAMRADDPLKSFGAVIGKALRPLASGTGLIPILVALQ